MLKITYSVIIIFSVISALYTGSLTALSESVFSGTEKAIVLLISMCGMMGIWCGVFSVLSKSGIVKKLTKIISPFLKFAFPKAYKTGEGIEEISANIAANLLGLGNAATPFGLKAMKKLGGGKTAGDDEVMLVVLNCVSFQIIPTTLITLRMTAGSANPYDVLPLVWIASGIGVIFAVTVTRIFSKIFK